MVALLEPGIQKTVFRADGEIDIPVYPDRIDEASGYLRRRDLRDTPILNRSRLESQVVAVLLSRYPNLTIVGDPGIGKTMLLERAAKIISGEMPPEEVSRVSPQHAVDYKLIRQRAHGMQHMDYILLPNFADPNVVNALSYPDPKQCQLDEIVADGFCRDVGRLFGYYGRDFGFDLKLKQDEATYRDFVRAQITDFYMGVSDKIADLVEGRRDRRKTRSPKLDFAVPILRTPKNLLDARGVGEIRFGQRKGEKLDLAGYKKAAGFTTQRKECTQQEVEHGLGKTYLPKVVSPLMASMMLELSYVDVDGLDEKQKFRIFREEFEKYTRQMESFIPAYQKGDVKSVRHMVSQLRDKRLVTAYPTQISDASIDAVSRRVDDVIARYAKLGSEDLKAWMSSVGNYFRTQRSTVERSLRNLYERLREHDADEDPELRLDRRISSLKSRVEDMVDRHLAKREEEEEKDYSLKIQYGGETYSLQDLLQVSVFRDMSAVKGAINVATIRDFSTETMFAKFRDPGYEDDGEKRDSYIPPHMRIESLGSFFKAAVILVPDQMDAFIQAIAGKELVSEEGSEGMGQLFLEYLESGTLTLVNDGVSYRFRAPRIIMGSANVDPFVVRQGVQEKYAHGLSDRVSMIYADSVIQNSRETRMGNLEIVLRAVEEFNDRNRQENICFRLTPETVNAFVLNTEIDEGLLDLHYRDLTKRVQMVLAYALTKERNGHSSHRRRTVELTLDHVKDYIRDSASPKRFSWVDSQVRDFGGYRDFPERSTGEINGLSVIAPSCGCLEVGGIMRVSSYLTVKPELLGGGERRFVMHDVESGLGVKDVKKGYDLAVDHLCRMLFGGQQRNSGRVVDPSHIGWQLKTQYSGNWGETGGPSASLAMTLSMLSALSEEDEDRIYRNRFVTGTIDPSNGGAGVIGGTYYKSLIPTRVHTLMEQLGRRERMYFMFPAVNLRDLSLDAMTDPYGMQDRVVSLPIINLGQAWYLATAAHDLTRDHWRRSMIEGPERLEQTLRVIRQKLPMMGYSPK